MQKNNATKMQDVTESERKLVDITEKRQNEKECR